MKEDVIKYLFGGMIVVLLAFYIYMQRYEIIPVGNFAYKIDKLTGEVFFMTGTEMKKVIWNPIDFLRDAGAISPENKNN